MTGAIGHRGLLLGGAAGAIVEVRRCWRIYITANNGNAYTSLTEIELRVTPGGADQTDPGLGFTNAFASSDFLGNHGRNAFDNSHADVDGWYTAGGTTFPHWVGWDFGAGNEKAIAEVAMHAEVGQLLRAPKDFIIQASADRVAWTDVKAYTNVTGWTSGFRTFSTT